MTIIWEDYVEPPLKDATEAEIHEYESKLGVKLPIEYKSLIIKNQGLIPNKELIQSDTLSQVPFGPLYHIKEKCTDEQLYYSAVEKLNKWSDYYPNVIPFADCAGTGCFFAFDYNTNKTTPLIVFVNIEEDPGSQESKLFVANDIRELLNKLTN